MANGNPYGNQGAPSGYTGGVGGLGISGSLPGSTDPTKLQGGSQQYNEGGLGGIMQNVFSGGGPTVVGPSGTAYGAGYTNAGAFGGAYNQMGASYTQQAPTVQNPYQAQSQGYISGTESQLSGLAGQYQDIISGAGPTLAQQQYLQSLAQGQAQQVGVARSAQGGPAMQAAAGRQAQQAAAVQNAGAQAVSTQIRQQQIQQALAGQQNIYNQMGQMQMGQYGIEQQAALANAQAALANQGQINQMQLGLYGLGAQEYGQQLGYLGGYSQGLAGQQQIGLQSEQQSNALGGQLGSAALAAGIMGLMLM